MPTLTATDVSRLLGRVAFGATSTDLDTWTGRPYEDLVEVLLTADATAPLPDDAVRLTFQTGASLDESAARAWWLERMRTTPFPLLERMTLLWHGHFATGIRYPPTLAHLVIQNQTLRAHALGNVRTLVEVVNTDPAMLYWLNGVENAPPKSNENYAREFFELFTLGKRPQVYTETDIRQAAKAFTGWYVDGNNMAQFAASRHNTKKKKVLGRTIDNLGADEHKALADVALDQPVAKKFLAYKLVANLAYLPSGNDALVNAVATAFTKNDWDVKAAVRTLLLHKDFRAASSTRRLVRSPVECVVHAAKVLDVRIAGGDLPWALEGMGQSLFDPVDVSGWPLGRDWVSPVTAIARYDAGLLLHRLATEAPQNAATPLPVAEDTAGWTRRLGLTALSTNTKNALGAYLRSAKKATPYDRQAGVLTLLLSSPEWVVL
ncbi:MAG TPA: DUF1800 domain-containing protein [Frankiaceae bacterium]|nr:DUF1800 domain-containing protein [Frankiaceae bacterium]